MTSRALGRRIMHPIVFAAVVCGAAVALPSSEVLAHAALDESSPASGAVLGASPEELVLDFDEAVTLDLGGVELTDADGAAIEIPAGEPDATDPTRVVVPDVPALGDGVYVVVWQVSSSDGHPAQGAFTFQVGAVNDASLDSEALIDAALSGRRASDTVSWSLGVARFLAFAGVTTLLGAVLVHVLSGDASPRRRARWTWRTAWGAAVIGTVGVFLLQGPYLSAGSLGDAFDPGLWGEVAHTRLGAALLVRLGVLAVAAVLVRRGGRPLVAWLATGLAAVLTFSTTGHPSASSPAAVSVLVDAVHLAAVAVWLGGLVGVMVARMPGERAMRRFSTMATVAVPVIVVSGVWQTWDLLGEVDVLSDLASTTWGRTLLVKLSLVVLLVTFGGASRWLLRHDGAGSVRRLVVGEMLIGGMVLGLTAGLVATPPAPPAPSQVFSATLVQGSLLADVSVTPGQVGANQIHVVLSPPGGALQPVAGASARLRSADLPTIPVTLTADGPNHFLGTLQLPTAGTWTLDLEVQPQANQTVVLSTTLEVPG